MRPVPCIFPPEQADGRSPGPVHRLPIFTAPPEVRLHIGGFFLIEAESHDEALRIAAEWPSARIGGIEVRPVQEELPMDRRYPSA